MSRSDNHYKVLLVDEHPVFREGLRSIIESHPKFQVVAETCSLPEAMALGQRFCPDLIVTELRLSCENGHDIVQHISATFPTTKIVVISALTDSHEVMRALQGGASGYLTKGASRQETLTALQEVAEGRSYLHPELAQHLFTQMRKPQPRKVNGVELTAREKDTLLGLCKGHSPQKVSEDLFLSVSTVKTYMRSLYRKLRVSTRSQLVLKAIELKLVPPVIHPPKEP